MNSGSSSLKYQLFKVDGDQFEVLAKGLADRIGIEGSLVTIKVGDGEKVTTKLPLPTHKEAIKEVLDLLLGSVLSSVEELSGVGHRVVHGGEYFDRSVLVDDEVIRIIDELSALAPLHNPAAVMGIKAIKQLLPNVPQVVAFDTAFHQTMKPEAFLYALPMEQYTKYKIRRYGFHGTSHLFVSRQAAAMLGRSGKFITCHIGNGASITAIEDGKCVDTSMGFTPLAGVVMGTRSGDVDPYVPLHIMKTQGKSVDEVNNLPQQNKAVCWGCAAIRTTGTSRINMLPEIRLRLKRCRFISTAWSNISVPMPRFWAALMQLSLPAASAKTLRWFVNWYANVWLISASNLTRRLTKSRFTV